MEKRTLEVGSRKTGNDPKRTFEILYVLVANCIQTALQYRNY